MYGKLSSNLKRDSFWESGPCQSFAHTFFRIQVYEYDASAKIGSICFIWKVPEETDQVCQHQTERSRKTTPNVRNTIRSKVFMRKVWKYCNSIPNSPAWYCWISDGKSTTVSLNLHLHFCYVRVSMYKNGSSCIIK